MNDVIPFQYSGKQVRVVTIEGEPWWVAKDVCGILGLEQSHRAIEPLDDDEKGRTNITTPGGKQSVSTVNEPGLYSLILRSRKPEAKKFKRWVTHEVLPQIRETGQYQQPTGEKLISLALVEAHKIIESQKPAVEFYQAVTNSKDAIPMSQVAKVLDMSIGRNNLFGFLREQGVLRQNNEPYQEYIDRGWFRVVEQKFTKPTGETQINIKTLVYQKGVDGIRRILKRERGAA